MKVPGFNGPTTIARTMAGMMAKIDGLETPNVREIVALSTGNGWNRGDVYAAEFEIQTPFGLMRINIEEIRPDDA